MSNSISSFSLITLVGSKSFQRGLIESSPIIKLLGTKANLQLISFQQLAKQRILIELTYSLADCHILSNVSPDLAKSSKTMFIAAL